MKKLVLKPESLRVHAFTTAETDRRLGTVRARESDETTGPLLPSSLTCGGPTDPCLCDPFTMPSNC